MPPSAGTGADRDAQGCLASAGYRWCARTQSCQRPWELANKEGIGADQVDSFCRAPAAR